MKEKRLPLLFQSVPTYRGPFIPTNGMRGVIHADGISEEDLLEIVGVKETLEVEGLGMIKTADVPIIFDPGTFKYVRAIRLRSSGKPINVWAA